MRMISLVVIMVVSFTNVTVKNFGRKSTTYICNGFSSCGNFHKKNIVFRLEEKFSV